MENRKIIEIIIATIAVIWIFSATTNSYDPQIATIIGVLSMWGIIMFSVRSIWSSSEKNYSRKQNYCSNCGLGNDSDSEFCAQCGKKLTNNKL